MSLLRSYQVFGMLIFYKHNTPIGVNRSKSLKKPRSGDMFIENESPAHPKPRSGDMYFSIYL